MSLPERVAPLIADLLAYSERDEFREAHATALAEFVSEAVDADGDIIDSADPSWPEFRDFFAFEHTLDDESEECILDRYILSLREDENAELVAVLEEFVDSVFGLFIVIDATPGELVLLEQPGEDRAFRVSAESLGEGFEEGKGVLGRLVPFRGHHEFSYAPKLLDAVNTYRASRWIYRDQDLALDEIGDPVSAYGIHRNWVDRPPVLEDAGDSGALDDFPPELYEDMQFEIEDAIDPDKFPDQTSLDEAVREAQYTWFETPQEALDDKSPSELIRERTEKIFDVTLEDPSQLPALGRLTWTDEQLAALCESESLSARVSAWSIRASRGEPIPAALIRELFDCAPYALLEDAVALWTETLPESAARVVTDELRKIYPDLPAVEPDDPQQSQSRRSVALDFLTERDLSASLEQIAQGLESEAPLERHFAIDALQSYASTTGDTAGVEALCEILARQLAVAREEGSDACSELLATLFTLATPEVFESALRETIDALHGDLQLLDSFSYHLEHAGIAPDLTVDLEDVVLIDQRSEDYEPDWRAFLPTTDLVASTRGRRLITLAFRKEVESCAQRRAHRKLVPLLRTTLEAALSDSDSTSEAFRPIAAKIEAIVAVLSSEEFLDAADRESQGLAAVILAALLSKAIRRRWPAREAGPALEAGDSKALRELLAVDEPWLTRALIDATAEQLTESDLTPFLASEDLFVRENALLVLARKSPGTFLEQAIHGATESSSEYGNHLRHVIRSVGEASLEPAIAALRSSPENDILEFTFLFAALVSGTERARYLVERLSHWFCRRGASGTQLVGVCLSIGSRSLAQNIISAIRDGRILLATPELLERQHDRAIADLDTLVAVFDLDENPRALLEENVTHLERQVAAERSAGLEQEPDWSLDDEGAEDYEHSHAHSHEHGPHCDHDHSHDHGFSVIEGGGSTFRHDTPQVRRNDPCPCGSGKKFKKCCGK